MPIRYEIDPDRGVVFASGEGVISTDDWFQARLAMLDEPAFRAGLDVLLDLRRARRPSSKPSTVSEDAARFRDLADRIGGIRIAVVVSSDSMYGLAREWSGWMSRGHADVFVSRDLEEAEEWLGLSE